MEKIMKLAALMREAKALIDEIQKDENITGVSVIEVNAYHGDQLPKIHMYRGLGKATNFVPAERVLVECDSMGDYWRDEVVINGVKFFEVDVEKKEADDNAKMAI